MIRIRHKYDASFTQISNQVARDTQLSYKARGIFLYLWSLSDKSEISLNDIELHSATDGQDSVRTGVRELERAGYLRFQRLQDKPSGKFLDTLWTLSDTPCLDYPNMGEPSLDNPNMASRASSLSDSEVLVFTPKTKNKTLGRKSAHAYSTDFLTFWDAYPVKVKKPKASETWVKGNCESIADLIIRSVYDHIAHDPDWQESRKGGTAIPHPTTYLNGQRWLDELASDPVNPVLTF